MPTLHANTDLVAVAWLGTAQGLTGIVGATLPKDTSGWASTGFVTVRTSGGSPDPYVPLRRPVVTVDCWGVSPGSVKPPWALANGLAELVAAACRASDVGRLLTLPGGYPTARVLDAYLVSEPRRAYGDQGGYARFVVDVALNWVELS